MAERGDIEAFEDVQHLERDEALRARRQLEQFVAAVVRRQRLHPLGAMVGQIAFVEQTVARSHVGGNRASDRPGVEGVTAAVGNQIERRRQPGVGKDLAGSWCAAVREERARRRRVQREPFGRRVPVGSDDLLHREPVTCVRRRRRERLRERDRAEPVEQLTPSLDNARHVDGERATGWHLVKPAPRVFLRRRFV